MSIYQISIKNRWPSHVQQTDSRRSRSVVDSSVIEEQLTRPSLEGKPAPVTFSHSGRPILSTSKTGPSKSWKKVLATQNTFVLIAWN